MADELKGAKIAIIATDGVEQVELTEPRRAAERAGADVQLLSPSGEDIQGFEHLDKADTHRVDRAVSDASPDEFDGLILPGGVANPDELRTHDEVVSFIRAHAEAKKPIAVICHGPWTLIDAGVARGRTLTSWPSLRADLENAGATWVDEEVCVDQGLVSSRKPDDLPAFCAKLVEEFAEGRHEDAPEPAGASAGP